MALSLCSNMTTQQIGYASMTVLIILAFIFQAVCFSFNNWYRMDVGPFMIRTGLWELRIYDEKNVTGLDAYNHEKAEFRFYSPIWKSAMDRMDKMANKAPPKNKPKKKLAKTTKSPSGAHQQDPDLEDMYNDPDYNELEHFNFKPGENWFNLPPHIPDTVWDQMQGNIDAAEALYSITWLATFTLMCLFAFHQFVPWFQVTIPVMRVFCAAFFVTGFFALVSVICYGNAFPPICKHIINAYEKSPNPKFAESAATSADCSFSAGFSLSVLSAIFLILTGIMAAVRICQLQRGETFDLGSAATTAVSVGKSLLGGAVSVAATVANKHPVPETQGGNFDWSQPEPTAAFSSGYDQGAYQATGTSQGSWERIE